jgi:SAM-dependent methyltransferase
MGVERVSATESHRRQTLASFDWQWAYLPSGDFMPGDPWFDANATRVLAGELCAIDPRWFQGKRVLDAGCGRGRWTRSLLELGAEVTAVDFSEAALERTRELCGPTDRLRTLRLDLLDIPDDLGDFDLVFSFGVLHHTGDTWGALENIARLVRPAGALVLYLYGASSWTGEESSRINRLRMELATFAFEDKISELRRRFPGDDPHQLFDLLSPTVNDRVAPSEVCARLEALGFSSVDQTIAHSEVYVRATRDDFPVPSLLRSVGAVSTFIAESEDRWRVRRGTAFETSLRSALSGVTPRKPPTPVLQKLQTLPVGDLLLDLSLPPDRLRIGAVAPRTRSVGFDNCPLEPGRRSEVAQGDVVIFLGAGLGACRCPERMLREAWNMVRPGGWLAVEVADTTFASARRTFLDRVRDRKKTVPGKLASVLTRHANWCCGEGLSALGGSQLLNPLATDQACAILASAGATGIEAMSSRTGAHIVTARSSI